MISFKKRKMVFAGALLLSLGLQTACGSTAENGGANQEEASSDSSILTVGISGAPVSLDLHAANDAGAGLVNNQIFETLVRVDENQTVLPGLATSWEKINDTTFEFNLREGVTFHNGEPFTANDVKYTFMRSSDAPQVAAIVGEVDPSTLYVVDDYTIQLGTHEPFAPLLLHLAHPSAGIMNEAGIAQAGDNVGRQPIGTGPFAFVEWDASDNVTLERFEDFHGDLPEIGGIVFRPIVETSQRTIELETGEIDMAIGVAITDRERIANHNNLELITDMSFQTNYLGFNFNMPPFDNKLVRQAINYAIDIDLIHQTILEGIGEVARGPIGSNVWGFYEGSQTHPFDVERARELLAEAGFPNGFDTVLATNDNPERVQLATIMANMMGEIGVNAEIRQMDWPTYLDGMDSGEFPMFMMGWIAVTGDADYTLFPLFHSSHHGGAGNRTFMDNAEVDHLLEIGRGTLDEDVRLKAYQELQILLADLAPWVPLNVPETTIGMQSNIGGFNLSPVGNHDLSTVYFN